MKFYKLLLSCCCMLGASTQLTALQTLSPEQSIARTLAPGKTDSLTVNLEDGDYVTASIAQNGRLNFVIAYSNGEFLRRGEGSEGVKNTIVFAAEHGGVYPITITNPGGQPVKYEFTLEKIVPLNQRLQPALPEDPHPSPRIHALKNQLASRQTGTEAFWKDVAAEGTPLVEPFGSDGKYQLVTFLWRSTYDTRNVLVIGSFWGAGAPHKYAMQRVANSDVWYLTLKLPSGARFTYQISPNDPMTIDDARASQRSVTRQSDPLNRHPLSACPAGTSKFRCSSVAELPGAAPQPWAVRKAGVPEARIEKHTIESDIQKLKRPVSVYTPSNYRRDGQPYAVIIMFDGEDLASDTYRLNTFNNLIAASKIPPAIAVFVDNIPGRRLVDLVANPAFADFLAKELMPWLRRHYHVTSDAKQVVLAGYSAGGLAAAYVGFRQPEVFGNVLSGSGAFWWSFEHHGGVCGSRCPETNGRGGDDAVDATTEGNYMAKQFLASKKLPLRFYLAAGTFEVDNEATGGGILETTRHLRDVLLAQGYDVHFQQFVSGHDGLNWRGMLAEGLMKLLGPRAR